MDNRKFWNSFLPKGGFGLSFVFILLTVMLFYKMWHVAIPGYFILAFLYYYQVRVNMIRHREITKYIENLTFNIDIASKDTLLNFPLPFLVVEIDGAIIWYNSSFKSIFEKEEQLEKTVNNLVKRLKLDSLDKDKANINENSVICGKTFNVFGNFVKTEKRYEFDNYILLLYFIDNSKLISLEKKYNNEKIATSLIIIDNYDELMQSMEDVARPQVLAEIDKKLNTWISQTGGIIKKFERDKYIFLFQQKYLNDFVEKRFEILDSIKEINVGNSIPVTLSIGIGIGEETINANFRFSHAALDIALGRGGDQVVVKKAEDTLFYGGKTRELEKRTKVKARVIAYALRELIVQSQQVIIMGHENGDIDSMGASLGIYRVVKNRGKSVHIVLNESNPSIDNMINKIKANPEYNGLFINRIDALELITPKTLLIVLDTHRPSFTECPELLTKTTQVVVIDHHRKGTDFIKSPVLNYQETYASSTCELITEILQYLEEKVKLKPLEAEALYSGIVVDTKNFTFKTGVRTFEAAAFLRRQGVDTLSVKQLFQNDIEAYINISNIIRNAEIFNHNIAISICPSTVKNAQLISAQAADQFLSLSGIIAAFVLSHSKDEIVISGRSLGDTNVQMILEKLGGGGHMSVAGAQLSNISIDTAKIKLKTAIKDYLSSIVTNN